MISSSAWKEFQNHECYLEMMKEVASRDAVLVACFRSGDGQYGPDAEIRARLSELDFVASMASAFEEEAKLIEDSNKEKDND